MDDETTFVSAETFAAGLSARMLHCRELGHNWAPLTVAWDKRARAYDRRLRCKICRVVRKQVLDSSGHVLANSYDYPKGYLATNVERGTFTRDVFRIESIHRWMDSHTTN